MVRIERGYATAEVRMDEDGDERVLRGYGAVYYNGQEETQYRLAKTMVERISPGAFDRAIREKDDVAGLFNHDSNMLLARFPGTMQLVSDDVGVRYEMQLGDNSVSRNVVDWVSRGDLKGSSFAFVPERVEWEEGDEYDIRHIRSVRLYDMGPVTYPAYKGSSTSLRSLDAIQQERESMIKPKPKVFYRLQRAQAMIEGEL